MVSTTQAPESVKEDRNSSYWTITKSRQFPNVTTKGTPLEIPGIVGIAYFRHYDGYSLTFAIRKGWWQIN